MHRRGAGSSAAFTGGSAFGGCHNGKGRGSAFLKHCPSTMDRLPDHLHNGESDLHIFAYCIIHYAVWCRPISQNGQLLSQMAHLAR